MPPPPPTAPARNRRGLIFLTALGALFLVAWAAASLYADHRRGEDAKSPAFAARARLLDDVCPEVSATANWLRFIYAGDSACRAEADRTLEFYGFNQADLATATRREGVTARNNWLLRTWRKSDGLVVVIYG